MTKRTVNGIPVSVREDQDTVTVRVSPQGHAPYTHTIFDDDEAYPLDDAQWWTQPHEDDEKSKRTPMLLDQLVVEAVKLLRFKYRPLSEVLGKNDLVVIREENTHG